jgi:hypothetical protein
MSEATDFVAQLLCNVVQKQEERMFPRVVWQEGYERVVQLDRNTLKVEELQRDAMQTEFWWPALPDAANDAIGKALLARLNGGDDGS